jgi:SAM-dependent methyltransferase
VNYWPDDRCAKAFWGQHELPPYRTLLADTLALCAPRAQEQWLDLGCGGGALTRGLWEQTHGKLAHVLGVDCAPVNARAYERFQQSLTPTPGAKIQFQALDFSHGLGPISSHQFDGVVSGLSITYAESRDPITGEWTTAAYDQILREVHRVLRPGGRFVLSVNVPRPAWNKVALGSLIGVFGAKRPIRYLQKAYRMMKYGRWLTREAESGRFHYLPANEVQARLADAGFVQIQHQLSYSGQAYIFSAQTPC